MGQTDRPDDRRAAGSRLPSNSESAVKRNHEPPKSGIPKRKKIEACPRLSCKIQYLLASNHRDQSTTSEYFTDDCLRNRSRQLGSQPFLLLHAADPAHAPSHVSTVGILVSVTLVVSGRQQDSGIVT